MAKQTKKTEKSDKEVSEKIEAFEQAFKRLENYMVVQTKLLNTNILRTASIVELLVDKKIMTQEEIEKKADEILKLIKSKTENMDAEDYKHLMDALETDDMGHA